MFLTSLSQLDPYLGTKFGESLRALAGAGITEFANAFSNLQSDADTAIKEFLDKCISAFDGYDDKFGKKAEDGVAKFLKGFTSNKFDAYSEGKAFAEKALNGIKFVIKDFKQAGVDTMQGYIDGMLSKGSDVFWVGYKLGGVALEAAKLAVDSNSPSKKFEKLGKDDGRGLVNGLEAMVPIVEDAASNMSSAALRSVAGTISNISQMIDDNLDFEPTITPIIDLSEIQNGIYSMNGMLNGNSLYLGNTSMNLARGLSPNIPINDVRVYNDANVVRAINDLESRLDVVASRMENLRIVLNSGEIVGATAPLMNNELGNMNVLTRRGVM